MSNTKTILGFIAGASIGAIAGILLAPDRGAETRKKIIAKSGDLADVLKESVTGWMDTQKKGVQEEIKTEETNTVSKMNTDIV